MRSEGEKSLSAYCAEAEQLIEQRELEAAIALGQHLLRHYPKYVNAYRVLARATLDQGQVGHAADLFKRVLSADPEDLESRVGLGLIYNEEEALEEALWQWERAFELAPGNPDIRAQLRQVRERLEGREFPRIELTRGALGRLYARGGLFQQAADEFQAVVRHDPQRVDVLVALAETLWRDGKLAAAEAICEQVLQELPNCLKANLLLGHIWLTTGREEESHGPFRIAQALEPENRVAAVLLGETSPLSAETVTVTLPDELPRPALETADLIPAGEALQEEEEEAELPDWLTQIRSAGMAEEVVEDRESLPNWLTAEESVEKPEEAPVAAAPVKAPPVAVEPEAAEAAEELPDWLAALRDQESELPDRAEVAEPVAPEIPSEREPLVFDVEEEDIPEWLRALSAEDDFIDASDLALEPHAEPETAPDVSARDVPAWLRAIESESDQTVDAVSEDETPARTAGPDQEPAGEGVEPELAAEMEPLEPETDDTDRWREIMRQEGLEQMIQQVPADVEAWPETEPAEDMPDWLTALQVEESEAEAAGPEAVETIQPPEVEEMPDWLTALQVEESEAEAAGPEAVETIQPPEVEEMPDWLTALQPEEAPDIQKSEPAAEPDVALDDETDLWREIMRQEGLEQMIQAVPAEIEGLPDEEEAAEGEIPDWLLTLQPEKPGEKEELERPEPPQPPAAEHISAPAEPAEAIPDWLAALRAGEPEAEAMEAKEAEEEPTDWLAALQADEPQEQEAVAGPEVVETIEPEEEAAPDWLAALQADEPEAEDMETAEVEEEATPETPSGGDTDLWREIMRQEGLADMIQAAPSAEPEPQAVEPEEQAVPDWLAALQADEPQEQEAVARPEVVETIEPEEEAAPDWLAALQADEPQEQEAVAGPEVVETIEPEEEAAPGWLAALQAEAPEEAPAAEIVSEAAEPGLEALAEAEQRVEETIAEGKEKKEITAEPVEEKVVPQASFIVSSYLRRLETQPKNWEVRLALARAYRDEKNPADAFEQYRLLVEAGQKIKELAPDLEGLCDSFPDDAAWHQLLGDAYMRANRLSDALAAYRSAQTALSRR
ncbi:MAG: tetratricopeptide repeat protein [Chloroflexota bacterium]